jgi:tRNA threonylcarbamoyladenosine biosynthesis protein TsaB
LLILALDTSSVTASCALVEDNKTVAESFLNVKITHSATMMPMVENLFKISGRDIKDVSLFAAVSGPGSFTGVRIGASILLGLAFGKGAACVGVSALEVTAAPYNNELFADKIICPVMDARRGQFYNALFKNGQRLTEDRAISADDLSAELKKTGLPVIVCGDGASLFCSLVDDIPFIKPPCRLVYPSASEAARLALKKYEAAEDKTVFTDLTFKPVYLRPSQAERIKQENQ